MSSEWEAALEARRALMAGKGLRINRTAIWRAKAADSDEKPKRSSSGSA